MDSSTLISNTLLDYKQEPLYPVTMLDRIFKVHTSTQNKLFGADCVISAVTENAVSGSSLMDAKYTGPVVFDASDVNLKKFAFLTRPTTNPSISFFNGNNSYVEFDSSMFAIGGNSKMQIKLDANAFSANGKIELVDTFDNKFVDSSQYTTGEEFIRTKKYNGSTWNTGYISKESLTPKVTVENPDASTVYYFVGTTNSQEGDVSIFYNSVDAADSSTKYIYWQNYNIFQTSDINLKDPIEALNVEPESIRNIDKFKFIWKGDETNKPQIGVSAQSVEEIFPELVSEVNGIKAVAYDKLSVVALAAIDKLTERIASLEKEIEMLKKK